MPKRLFTIFLVISVLFVLGIFSYLMLSKEKNLSLFTSNIINSEEAKRIDVSDLDFDYQESEVPFQVFEHVVNTNYLFDAKNFILPKARLVSISENSLEIRHDSNNYSIPLNSNTNVELFCVALPKDIDPEKVYIDLLRTTSYASQGVSISSNELYNSSKLFLSDNQVIYLTFKSDYPNGLNGIFYFKENCE